MREKVVKILLMLGTMGFLWFGALGYDIVALASTEEESIELPMDQVLSQIKLEPVLTQATGTSYQLVLQNNTLEAGTYTLQWISSMPTIATVTAEDGIISALSQGTTIVTCVLTVGEYQYLYSCAVTVTDPKFDQDIYYISPQSTIYLPILGTYTGSVIYTSSDNNVVMPATGGMTVTGVSNGVAVITAEVDKRVISCQVVVSSPIVNYSDLFLVTGKTATLRVTGHSRTTPITFVSSNPKVVKVSAKGYVKTVKKGSAVITITVDGRVYNCYVASSKSSIISSIKRGYSVLGSKYSQKLRMKKGYYDCSSLVWRCFSKAGYYFGQKTYAPTAAAQAQRLVKKRKVLCYKGISQTKLLPGDLLYMKNSTKNGRYKNIGHVAIYIGNGRILHATDMKHGVCIDNYNTYKNRIVLIGRI